MNTDEHEKPISNGEPSRVMDSGEHDRNRISSRALISPERTQKRDLLLHLISNLSLSLVVCGPDGIGKTTILHQIESCRKDAWTVCYLPTTSDLGFVQIQKQLVLSSAERAQFSDQDEIQTILTERLQNFEKKNRHLVLLLDDAGNLAPGLLTELCQFTESFQALSMVFSMTPDSLHIKSATDPMINDCHIVEIPPLNQSQCGEYLQNLSGKPSALLSFKSITPPLIERIYRETHGIPGGILSILPEISRITTKSIKPNTIILLGVIGFIVATAIGLGIWESFTRDQPALPMSGEAVSHEGATNVELLLPANSPDRVADINKFILESIANEDSKQIIDIPEDTTEQLNEPITVKLDDSGNNNRDLLDPHQISLKTAEAGMEIQPSVMNANEPGKVPIIPDQSKQSSSKLGGQEKKLGSELKTTLVQSKVQVGISTKEPINQAKALVLPAKEIARPVKAKEIESRKAKIAVIEKTGISFKDVKGPDWLLKQDPKHYTLQLLAVRQLDALKKLVGTRLKLKNLAFYISRKKGSDWYALVYGIYPSLDDAKKVAKNLPHPYQQAWPRSLKLVQAQIRAKAD